MRFSCCKSLPGLQPTPPFTFDHCQQELVQLALPCFPPLTSQAWLSLLLATMTLLNRFHWRFGSDHLCPDKPTFIYLFNQLLHATVFYHHQLLSSLRILISQVITLKVLSPLRLTRPGIQGGLVVPPSCCRRF